MFQRILISPSWGRSGAGLSLLSEKHAELDGDHHGPMAHKLLENMCDGNSATEHEIVEQHGEVSSKESFYGTVS